MEKGCPNCGRMIDATYNKCPYCNYDFSQLNALFKHYEEEAAIKVPKYAGFIKRVVANGIDFWILFVFIFLIELGYLYIVFPEVFNGYDWQNMETFHILKMCLPFLCFPIIYFFYCVFCQHSKLMATLGERFLGLEVVNTYDEPITWGEAFGRNLAKILDILTLGIGFLIIIVTKKKQALSDIVSRTVVINKVTGENYNEFSYAHLFRRLSAFIIDIVILNLIIWGIQYLQAWVSTIHIDYRTELIMALNYLSTIILIFYFPLLEKKMQGSLGKKILKIKVIKLNGEKIGFIRALFRFSLMIIESVLIPLAVLLPFVTPRKQTIKDILTKTVVVNVR